jgi:hypothetical protein
MLGKALPEKEKKRTHQNCLSMKSNAPSCHRAGEYTSQETLACYFESMVINEFVDIEMVVPIMVKSRVRSNMGFNYIPCAGKDGDKMDSVENVSKMNDMRDWLSAVMINSTLHQPHPSVLVWSITD